MLTGMAVPKIPHCVIIPYIFAMFASPTLIRVKSPLMANFARTNPDPPQGRPAIPKIPMSPKRRLTAPKPTGRLFLAPKNPAKFRPIAPSFYVQSTRQKPNKHKSPPNVIGAPILAKNPPASPGAIAIPSGGARKCGGGNANGGPSSNF